MKILEKWYGEMREYNPMLAYPSKPFNSDEYLYELKYDGTRAICYIENEKIKLINRRNNDITERYPEIVNALKDSIKAKEIVLDGEIVYFENGKPNFYKLAEREHINDRFRINVLSKLMPTTFMIFDILYVDGKELINLPLIERKKILKEYVIPNERIKIVDFIVGKGIELFEFAKSNGYEGIMAKRIDGIYEEKRSYNWLKIKVVDTLDVVVLGFSKGNGERENFGSLLVGAYVNEKLRYLGSVGSGFDKEKIEETLSKLKNDVIPKPENIEIPNDIELPNREIFWVKPKYVVEVKYLEITKNLQLRNPTFVRFREDKRIEECVLIL